jgi:hypothetical protein
MAEHCSMLVFMMIHCSSYALWTDARGMAPAAPGLGPLLLHGGDSFSFLNCDPGSDIIDPNTVYPNKPSSIISVHANLVKKNKYLCLQRLGLGGMGHRPCAAVPGHQAPACCRSRMAPQYQQRATASNVPIFL